MARSGFDMGLGGWLAMGFVGDTLGGERERIQVGECGRGFLRRLK